MPEYKYGTLKSGSGAEVKSRNQTIATGLSEARGVREKTPAKKRTVMKNTKRFNFKNTNIKSLYLVLTFLFSYSLVFSQNNSANVLPPPYATKSAMNFSNAIGWDNGRAPTAPTGFIVTN